jgi:hypothetical protein
MGRAEWIVIRFLALWLCVRLPVGKKVLSTSEISFIAYLQRIQNLTVY